MSRRKLDPNDPVQVYRKAAKIVRKGWTTGQLKSGDRYCAIGAIQRARVGEEVYYPTDNILAPLAELLREQGRYHCHRLAEDDDVVASFNDCVAKDAEAVAEVLEEAADRLVEARITAKAKEELA